MRTVFEERHVFDRNDARHDALVAVTAGHLVARLDLALHSDEDLDHLHDARRHFVAALDLLDLVHEALFKARLGFVVLATERFEFALNLLVLDREHPPLRAGIFGNDGVRKLGALLEALRTGNRHLAAQHVDQTAVDVTVEDRLLVVAVLCETLDFLALDRHRALVLFNAVAVEDAHFDDGAIRAGRHAHGGVANVGCLFTEDGAQELFFRRHRAFALRRDLADEDIARLNFGTDVDDTGFVEVLQRFFRNVRNVTRDFFRTKLGVTRHHFEFFDVNGGEHVVGNDPLGEQDRSLRSCSRSKA